MAARSALLRALQSSRQLALQRLCAPAVATAAFHAAAASREGNPSNSTWLAAQQERKKLLSSLLYRSKQRGFLELDLLVGGWAEANLASLSDEDLAAYSVLLAEENPDLFKWLTGQLPAPPGLATNPAFVKLHAHVVAHLAAHAQSATRNKAGKDWVRGWGDSGLPSSGNQQ